MGKSARLFNGNADVTLIGRITPSNTQRAYLQDNWNHLVDHLKPSLKERSGYEISTWLQGSYKFGTLLKPVRLADGYDVDVGVYFEWEDGEEAAPAASQLRAWVKDELEKYAEDVEAIKHIEEPSRDRCERVVYRTRFHIDTPVYHLEPQKDRRRLACKPDRWEESDPKAIYKWFRDVVDAADCDRLRRLVRYLKAWAALTFTDIPKSRPSSILLTVLSAEAMLIARKGWTSETGDDDACADVVARIDARLTASKIVKNPIDSAEDLNRIPNDAWDDFLERLHGFRDICSRAIAADDEVSASLIWAEAFSYLMPLPEADRVEMVDEGTGRALMPLPEIEVEVYARNPTRFVARYLNEVPSVARDCDLKFRIINPAVVPDYATVEWTVRNEGEEADAVNDLGHSATGINKLESKEHTAYQGRHFMDCVVRVAGNVYAVRRVPVNIRDQTYPQRNPPRPAYTKLRSVFRRRR